MYVSQDELEHNFEDWREYQSNKTLSASKRRMYMAFWLNEVWGLMQTMETFIEKTFDATVLINKFGQHKLRMKRLEKKYQPNLDLS